MVTHRWIKYIEANSLPGKIDEDLLAREFQFKLSAQKQPSIETQEFLRGLPGKLQEIRGGWNYSLKELDHYVTRPFSQEFVEQVVRSVVATFLFWHPSFQASSEMVSLALFLCMLNASHTAYFFLEYIYVQIVPDRIIKWDTSDYELQFLNEIAKTNGYFTLTEQVIVFKFLELFAAKMLRGLLINTLTFSSLFFLFDLLIKFKSFYELEKTVVIIAKMHIDEIRDHLLNS